MTVNLRIKIRTIELEGKRVKLQIWNTADQELLLTFHSFANELSISFIETSARVDDENVGHVEQAFTAIATGIKRRIDSQQTDGRLEQHNILDNIRYYYHVY
ncbi:Ras-related protein Rab-1A isoform X2 [Aphelenchoides besseyi]|nr:Ras-related protein Rab-1A isoform X2 [Aphelenchoides besseyi]